MGFDAVEHRVIQVSLLPVAFVMVFISFPFAVLVHDVLDQVLNSFTNEDAQTLMGFLATFGAMGFWCAEIWLIYKFVVTGGLGILDR